MSRENGGGSSPRTTTSANSAIPSIFNKTATQPWHAPMAPPPPPRQAPAPVSPSQGPTSTSRPPSYAPPQSYAPSNRVGNNSNGTISPIAAPATPAPPPAPVAPDINSFLAGDTAYQTQVNELKKAFGDYQANQKLQTGQYNTQYGVNTANLAKQQGIDQTATTDDYASRGLLNSGVYTKAYGDLSTEYAGRQKALDTGKADFLSQLAAAAQTYQQGQGTTSAKAKQDAINRRAAQYGV